MADLSDSGRIVDTFPANGNTGVPLLSNITLTLSGLDYDTDSLLEGFFIEGPDNDQLLGPSLQTIGDTFSDDYLGSPGLQGIVDGTTTISGIGGNTVITFDPTLPLGALTEYTANLAGVLEADAETTISGYATFSFTTGSGSIEEIPSTTSTSILSLSSAESSLISSGGLVTPLEVVDTTPADHSVENIPETDEIIVEFNKPLNSSLISGDNITVETFPATDHPEASITSVGELAKTIEVDGSRLKIKI